MNSLNFNSFFCRLKKSFASDNLDSDTPICYLICGFIGAGKTTYSKQLALKTQAIHLNTDEWCVKLFENEYKNNWDECFSKTVDELWNQVALNAKQGRSVIFDMGFWTKQSRKNAIREVIKLGMSPQMHYIYASDRVLKDRIAKRGGKFADYNLSHFDEFKRKFEKPTFHEKHLKIKNYKYVKIKT